MPYINGTKTVLTLRKYIDGQPTEETKANTLGDPDYIAPYLDTVSCPITNITTTSTTTTTTSTSTTTTTSTTNAPSSTLTLYADVSTSTNPLQGWSSSSNACAGTGTPITVYLSTASFSLQDAYTNGRALYSDSGLTTPYAGNDTYFKDVSSPGSGNALQVGNDGTIATFSACTTTTSTTTTTTTTAATYYYIAVRECTDYNSNGALEDRVVRSLTDITGWSHVLIPRYSGDTGAVYEKYGSSSQGDLATAYTAGTYDLPSVDLDSTASSNGVTVASLEKTQC
jgi:hypothetical protein